MTGGVVALDIMWAREQPGLGGKEGNAAAVQVLVAHGDGARSPGVCCRKRQIHRLRPPRPLLPALPCSHGSRSQTSLEANAVSAERGSEEGRVSAWHM